MVKLFSKNSNLCDHNSPTSQTDGQTDGQTTCDRNTALCTKVHRAVKTAELTAAEFDKLTYQGRTINTLYTWPTLRGGHPKPKLCDTRRTCLSIIPLPLEFYDIIFVRLIDYRAQRHSPLPLPIQVWNWVPFSGYDVANVVLRASRHQQVQRISGEGPIAQASH